MKRVYLDQSFLSNVAKECSSEAEARIFSKLQDAKVRGRVSFIVSDVHVRETSAIPDEFAENRRRIFAFQNDLADGNIADDWRDVFVAQHRRMLSGDGESDFFPVSDLGLKEVCFQEGRIRVQLTNSWRMRLSRSTGPDSNEFDAKLAIILDRQVANVGDMKSLDYVRGLWIRDVRKGILARQRRREIRQSRERFVEACESGATGLVPPKMEWPEAAFSSVVSEVVKGLDEVSALDRWLNFLNSNSVGSCPSLLIRIACEAQLLDTRAKGHRSSGKKFRENFGRSRQADIDHISAFVPYVDALTTDRDMHNLCEADIVAKELKSFPCELFSTKNYKEFETWLDSVPA
ncbi:MAG: hypothetical protein Q8M11_23555 [Sulfuritalea sp.]|nr:hypothetical protein [Sulfuritalea sp.]MDP1981224.1 hypothetical protein [Sulfuritalea sp.]